ncbi:RluA family pseudouridine synthase [Bombilactobacillus folatiphilus]|uniref:Pseudouridine synthase n=1 Tax=Bombilactobacillus folatiphilus TaxID=2923362 RepID=A0ABY4P781_9LACO|nr:RluA family pseudouridine synthase [Bombilactobacillus folatiphilus]UQS81472.1 RluA family pseudouridine synthase [Bombilactobacillus folatiphilus]
MKLETFEFKNPDDNQRLDKEIFLYKKIYTRAQIQKWIKSGQVLVNGTRVTKTGFKLKLDDQIQVTPTKAPPLKAFAQNLSLEVIYEDQDVLVVNKPQGMVVHPSAGHPDQTLVNAILYHTQLDSQDEVRPGIVHRIDKDTSGLLMVAKTDLAQESLSQQLKNKTNLRRYVAIVHAPFSEQEGTIDAPIGRDPQNRKQQAVLAGGKSAITHFRVLENFADYALIECQLETGRTHQIRVHLQYIGHPVAGDPLYGPRQTLKGSGQFLHAQQLGFYHPRTGKWLEFEVEPPKIFQEQLRNLQLVQD